MQMKTALLALLPLCAAPVALAGSQVEKAPLPIDVTVTPATALPAGEVVISGTTLAMKPRGNRVTIRVTPPGAAPVTQAIDVPPSGEYRWSFSGTRAVGRYEVTVTAPDGVGSATTRFSVEVPDAVEDETAAAFDELLRAIDANIDALEKAIDEQPDSPAEEEAKEALDPADDFDYDPGLVDPLRELFKQTKKLTKDVPEALPVIQPLLAEAVAARDEMKSLLARLDDRMKSLRTQSAACDGFEAMREALNVLSLVTDYTLGSGWLDRFGNYLNDKLSTDAVADLIGGKAKTPEGKLAVAAWTNAASGFVGSPKLQSARQYAKGMLVNALSAAGQKVFDAYCEQFQGTFKGSYTQDLLSDGKLFWTYTMQLEGDLSIRYLKSSASKSEIDVSGDLRGSVTKYRAKENVVVIQPGIARGVLVRTPVMVPPGTPWSSRAGAAPQAALPSSFLVPLRGVIRDDKLALQIAEQGVFDVSDLLKARVWFLMNDFSAPVFQRFELGFRKAAWILNRATNGNAVLDIKVDKAKKVSRIQKIFDREDKQPSFRVAFDLSLDACNPECP